MQKSKLKEIFSQLRANLNELEAEIYSDTDSYLKRYVHPWDAHINAKIKNDNDDDGYPD